MGSMPVGHRQAKSCQGSRAGLPMGLMVELHGRLGMNKCSRRVRATKELRADRLRTILLVRSIIQNSKQTVAGNLQLEQISDEIGAAPPAFRIFRETLGRGQNENVPTSRLPSERRSGSVLSLVRQIAVPTTTVAGNAAVQNAGRPRSGPPADTGRSQHSLQAFARARGWGRNEHGLAKQRYVPGKPGVDGR